MKDQDLMRVDVTLAVAREVSGKRSGPWLRLVRALAGLKRRGIAVHVGGAWDGTKYVPPEVIARAVDAESEGGE